MAKDDIEQLPTVVLRAVTAEQSVALMKESNAAALFDRECNLRARRTDKFGNEFRQRGRTQGADGGTENIYDIWLRRER